MVSYDQIKKLREKRANLVEQSRRLLEEAGDKPMSADANRSFDKIHVDIQDLRKQEEGLEAQRTAEQELADADERDQRSTGVIAGKQDRKPVVPGVNDGEEGRDEDPSKRAISAKERELARRMFFLGGRRALRTDRMRSAARLQSPDVLDSHFQQWAERAEAGDMAMPEEIRATLTTGDQAGVGILIPQGEMQPLQEAREQFGTWRNTRATSMPTSHGREMPIPSFNDTANKGQRLGETRKVGKTDLAVKKHTLNAYIYTANRFDVSMQALADVEYPLENLIAQVQAARIERAFQEELTTYSGSGGPKGVVPSVGVGKTAASATAITYDELLELKHSVLSSYRINGAGQWMFSDDTLLLLSKLKDGDGRPLFLKGDDIAQGAKDRLLGHEYAINDYMPNPTASKRSVLFGDLSWVWYRDVTQVEIIRQCSALGPREVSRAADPRTLLAEATRNRPRRLQLNAIG